MTLAIDHTSAHAVTPRLTCWVFAVRAWAAAFYQHWFVDCAEPPSDPFASLSSRERWDLPVFHPAQPEA